MESKPPRFLDQVRMALRARHYSIRTETAYVAWTKRFILFHGKRHPETMGVSEVNAYLTHLAVIDNVSASTQNQALAALLFVYETVVGRPLEWNGDVIRAGRPKRLPVVLSREEMEAVLRNMDGVSWVIGALLYGAGMRLLECLRLRVKDLDFAARVITIREGKGDRDRRVMFPAIVMEPLREHLQQVRALHLEDLAEGHGAVWLPHALERKYDSASREWSWQWVFPAGSRSIDPRSGREGRHHLGEQVVQRAVRSAVQRAKIGKPATPHTFRDCAASPIMPSRWAFHSLC